MEESTSTLEAFTYTPLESGQIRLFELETRSDFHSEIRGHLRHVSFGASPSNVNEFKSVQSLCSYTALSWAWEGDWIHLEPIICDGRRLEIRSNLKQALRRIRKLASTEKFQTKRANTGSIWFSRSTLTTLWIDAVCINQNDLQERADQVRKMEQIYNKNDGLIVWLGELDRGDIGREQARLLNTTHAIWTAILEVIMCKTVLSDKEHKSLFREVRGRREMHRHRWQLRDRVQSTRSNGFRAYASLLKLLGCYLRCSFIPFDAKKLLGIALLKTFPKKINLDEFLECAGRIFEGACQGHKNAEIVTDEALQGLHYINERLAFTHILARPWFTRRWVIQETFAFPYFNSYLLMSDAVCDVAAFVELIAKSGLPQITTPFQRTYTKPDFFDAMYLFEHHKCSDARDLIFAVRGVTRGGTRMLVDYNLNTRETYLRSAVILGLGIDESSLHDPKDIPIPTAAWTGLIRMLVLAGCRRIVDTGPEAWKFAEEIGQAEHKLETWVPDWRAQRFFFAYDQQKAAEASMGQDNTNRWDVRHRDSPRTSLDSKLWTSRSGHRYLALTGITLNAPSETWLESTINEDEPRSLFLMRHLCRACAEHLYGRDRDPDVCGPDNIWLWLLPVSDSQLNMRSDILCFMLAPARGESIYRGRPVRRLLSCFFVGSDDAKVWCRYFADIKDGSVEIREEFDSVNLILDNEFCLE